MNIDTEDYRNKSGDTLDVLNNKIKKVEGMKPVKGKESVSLSEEPENNSDNTINLWIWQEFIGLKLPRMMTKAKVEIFKKELYARYKLDEDG